MEEAVKSASHSAPGPDGVPFLAWKRLGSVAVDILFRAASDMSAEGGPERLARFYEDAAFPGQSFNSSLMVFLPKSPTGQLAEGGDLLRPRGHPPLEHRKLRQPDSL